MIGVEMCGQFPRYFLRFVACPLAACVLASLVGRDCSGTGRGEKILFPEIVPMIIAKIFPELSVNMPRSVPEVCAPQFFVERFLGCFFCFLKNIFPGERGRQQWLFHRFFRGSLRGFVRKFFPHIFPRQPRFRGTSTAKCYSNSADRSD